MPIDRRTLRQLIFALLGVVAFVAFSVAGFIFVHIDELGFLTGPPSDVHETNLVRAEKGIRQIKQSWRYQDRRHNEEKWKDETRALCKVAKRDGPNGKLVWEQDYYYSGRMYPDKIDESRIFPERLTLTYNYLTSELSVAYSGNDAKTRAIVDTLDSDGTEESNERLCDAVDRILKRWKVSRL